MAGCDLVLPALTFTSHLSRRGCVGWASETEGGCWPFSRWEADVVGRVTSDEPDGVLPAVIKPDAPD